MTDMKDTRYNKMLARSLASLGDVNEGELETALAEAGQREVGLDTVLLEDHKVTEEALLRASAQDSGLTPVDLRRFRPAADALKVLTPDQAAHYRVLPLARTPRLLTLVVANPYDVLAFEDVQLMTGLQVVPVIATASRVREAIRRRYGRSVGGTTVVVPETEVSAAPSEDTMPWPSMERSEKMLAEQLLEAKVLGSAKLDAALSARTGGRFLADRLVNQHDADEVAIAETLAMWKGWPFIDPALHTDDAGAQQTVPLSVWQQYGLIPIDRCGDFLTVATSNYLADDVVRALELASGCRVRPLVATVASIRRILDTVPEADSEPLRARND